MGPIPEPEDGTGVDPTFYWKLRHFTEPERWRASDGNGSGVMIFAPTLDGLLEALKKYTS